MTRRYLLDTNVWVGLARGEDGLMTKIQGLGPSRIVSCSVVLAELMFGARKSQRVEANLIGVTRLLSPFESLPFDSDAASHYGVIRADLERAGTPIGSNDLLIAAIARSRDLLLVTRNMREFVRVAGLRVEQW